MGRREACARLTQSRGRQRGEVAERSGNDPERDEPNCDALPPARLVEYLRDDLVDERRLVVRPAFVVERIRGSPSKQRAPVGPQGEHDED